MEKKLILHKNKKQKNLNKLKWASLMIAGLMTLNSCSTTITSKREKGEYERTMEGIKTHQVSKTQEKLPAGVDVNSKSKTENKIEKRKSKDQLVFRNANHMQYLDNIEKIKWRDYFKTGTVTILSISFGKEGRKIKEKSIEKDPYFSITELDNIRNPLNPINLKISDPMLYDFLDDQMKIYNQNNPKNQKTMEDFILNYIKFFGFDILDKIKIGEIKFEQIKY
jgi:hypothetical protein